MRIVKFYHSNGRIEEVWMEAPYTNIVIYKGKIWTGAYFEINGYKEEEYRRLDNEAIADSNLFINSSNY